MRRGLLIFMAAFVFALFTGDSKAFQKLDIEGWLAEPGVKLLAVEFYATWCEPCKKAIPKWEQLRKKYRAKGLRLVVVAVQSEGNCSAPDWNPDSVVCDYEGDISSQWNAKELPQAFLWSWQGNLLIQNGTAEQVEKAVEAFFADAPRILVEDPVDVRGDKLKDAVGADLQKTVRGELKRGAKFDLVATDSEKKELRALLKKGSGANFDQDAQCKLGEEVSPNSLLKIMHVKTEKAEKLRLELFSIEKGCLIGSAVAPVSDGDMDAAAIEASSKLLKGLHREVSYPSGAKLQKKELKTVIEPTPKKNYAPAGQGSGTGLTLNAGNKYYSIVGEDANKLKEMENAWNEVKSIAMRKELPHDKRRKVVQEFLKDYPSNNSYLDEANHLITVLDEKDEPVEDEFVSPEWFRTKTEWFSLRAYGGNYGGGGTVTFFTIRWKYFYWDILRNSNAAGGPGFGDNFSLFMLGGTSFGVPVFLTNSNKHELRFGTGLMGGYMASGGGSGSNGPIMPFHANYVWHSSRYFALYTGFDLFVPTMDYRGGTNDLPDPAAMFTFGFTI